MIGLDYFDASINRIAAWATGARNMQKSLLFAALQPIDEMKKMQDDADFTSLILTREAVKVLPFGDVWNEYCRRAGVPDGTSELFPPSRLTKKTCLQKDNNSESKQGEIK